MGRESYDKSIRQLGRGIFERQNRSLRVEKGDVNVAPYLGITTLIAYMDSGMGDSGSLIIIED